LLPRDPDLAEIFAESAQFIADNLDTSFAAALAARAKAQVLYNKKKCAEAQPLFERAAALFATANADGEVGRTLVAQMDNMSYLSMSEEPIRLEPRTRAARLKTGDRRYLCNLEIALGNLYYRLNRFTESLSHYDRARQLTDNPFQIAAIGMN